MSHDVAKYQDLKAAIDCFRAEHGDHLVFPEEIKTPVLKAAADLGTTKVGKFLGISPSAIFRWKRDKVEPKSKSKGKRLKFVELDGVERAAKAAPASPSRRAVTITTPTGLVVSVSADLPPAYVAALIAAGGRR